VNLPYDFRIATAEESRDVHIRAYGRQGWRLLSPLLRCVGGDDLVRFACVRCGHCCQMRAGELLSEAEAVLLANVATLSGLPLPVEDRGRRRLPRKPDGSCAWLEGGNICRVQDCKPVLCALGPCGAVMDHERKLLAAAVKVAPRQRTYDRRECLGVIGGTKVWRVEDWLFANGAERFVGWHQAEWLAQSAEAQP
jgi:hypothetical protein